VIRGGGAGTHEEIASLPLFSNAFLFFGPAYYIKCDRTIPHCHHSNE
jgi:hypothetical protein